MVNSNNCLLKCLTDCYFSRLLLLNLAKFLKFISSLKFCMLILKHSVYLKVKMKRKIM
jgi:hypothetical protein